jgi:hypothetical protein
LNQTLERVTQQPLPPSKAPTVSRA